MTVNNAVAARRRDARAFAGALRKMKTPAVNGALRGLSGAFMGQWYSLLKEL
jgi:hypothetical protein